jgi:hypothetical protein
MFYDYSLDQWIGLFEYCCIVLTLCSMVCFVSAKATYMSFDKKTKKRKVRDNKKAVKKQIFFDVA